MCSSDLFRRNRKYRKKVIQVIGDKTIFRQENGLDWYLTSIWFNSGKKYYIGGGGLFIFNNIKNEWVQNSVQPNWDILDIKGDELNNIFLTAGYNILWHFNGVTWVDMTSSIDLVNGSVGRIAINKNIIVTVGSKGSQAVIVMGRR